MKKVYLAGPDIFYPDSKQRRDVLIKLCHDYGFQGLFPGDNDISPLNANTIREANLQMIKVADCILANLSPFRGFEPDSGTVFEVGYACALNKIVVGYSHDSRSLIERLREYQSLPETQNTDKDGLIIENFGLPNNLMFGDKIIASSAKDALAYLSTRL